MLGNLHDYRAVLALPLFYRLSLGQDLKLTLGPLYVAKVCDITEPVQQKA